MSIAIGEPSRVARASSRVRWGNRKRVFGSPVRASVTDSSCVRSKTSELSMTAAILVGHARREAPVVVGEVVRQGVVEHDHPDDLPVHDERHRHGRVELADGHPGVRRARGRRAAGDARARGDGAADDAGAVAEEESLERGVTDAAGEAASHDAVGGVAQEQRAGRERDERAHGGRDRVHRVGHTEARAHGFGDLVQAVSSLRTSAMSARAASCSSLAPPSPADSAVAAPSAGSCRAASGGRRATAAAR